jgi:hypothetical protein
MVRAQARVITRNCNLTCCPLCVSLDQRGEHRAKSYIPEDKTLHVGFEALTAVVLKSTIFWDITPCRPLKVNRHFGGTYSHLLSRWYLARLIWPWRWRRYAPPKRRLTVNGLHGIKSQKIVLLRTLHNHRCDNLKSYIDSEYLRTKGLRRKFRCKRAEATGKWRQLHNE